MSLCERCGKLPKQRTLRYCPKCRYAVIAELRREGYIRDEERDMKIRERLDRRELPINQEKENDDD